ncbi:MAG: acyltransferase family protein [Flavisolibacter sp.]
MSSNPIVTNRTHYPALDVLRGIAILLVLFCHNFNFLQIFKFGWTGVDLFFVLSGFLITDILIASQRDKNYFRNFYARRFLRIFPLYYGTLIVFFCVAPYFVSKENISVYNYYNQNQAWFWSDMQNWLFVRKGLGQSPFLTHFWSLAVEEQFYIIWPFFIFLIKDLKKMKIVIVSLILLALVIRVYMWSQYPFDMVKYYCNTLTRMDSILMGCLLSIHIKDGKELSVKVLKYILSFCIMFFIAGILIGKNTEITNPFFSTIGYTIVSLFFATLLYIFVKKEFKLLTWLKKSPMLNYVGKISYGMYVFHIPVYVVLSSVLMKVFLLNYGMTSIQALFAIASISFVITVLASSLSFYLLERPILGLKRYFQ